MEKTKNKEQIMKLNKTLLAALVLTLGLTGCDSMVNNKNQEKEADAPVVEENKDQAEGTEEGKEAAETPENEESADMAENDGESEEASENADGEEAANAEENKDNEEASETTSTADMTVEEKREALEQAIFDNRSQARAAELLLEMAPEKVEDIRPQLEALIEKSNDVLARAQQALDQLN